MSSPFPTPRTVGWHSCTRGTNDLDEVTHTYYPPLDQPGAPRQVIGWGPTKSDEPEPGRTIADIDLLVPPGFTASPDDVADLPIGRFEVAGYPLDYNHGPFGFTPGSVVQLKRVEH